MFDKNVVMKLAMELDIKTLKSLCSTSKRMNLILCNNKDFWRNKLYREYPATIEKFPNTANFRQIYLSLINKEKHKYQVLIGTYENKPPLILPYVKKDITTEDFSVAEKFYPNIFNEAFVDMESFEIVGNFPSGTKIFLAYLVDYDIGYLKGFLTQTQAIEELVNSISALIEADFDHHQSFEEIFEMLTGVRRTPEEFYGGNLQQVNQKNMENLMQKGYSIIQSYDPRRRPFLFPIYLVVAEVFLP